MNKQSGFTLIEIVMVLVLLGILTAVAVPKYFDMQAQAEERAAQAILAEFQARINGRFAQELLGNKTCAGAQTEAAKEITKATADIPAGSKYSIESSGLDKAKGTVTLKVTFKNAIKSGGYTFEKVPFPKCN